MIVRHSHSLMNPYDKNLHVNGIRRNAYHPNEKLKNYHLGLVSLDSIGTKEKQSIPNPIKNKSCCHTPHYNWAFGVLLYLLLCGPPRNNAPLWYINFYNSMQMGVHVVPSQWFGSPGNRRKWKELDVQTKRQILKLINSESATYVDAYKTDIEWLSFNNNLPCSSKSACQGCVDVRHDMTLKTLLFKLPCPVTKEYRKFMFDDKKVLCGPIYNAITNANDQEKADTRDQWN